jgi:hypothetical protein
MKLKRAVTVKAIVTEDFKSRMKEELTKTLTRIDTVTQQLEFQLRKYVPEVAKADLEQAGRLRREIEAEKQRHESMKAEIDGRLQEALRLEIGAEFDQGTIESEIEVSVGDNLMEKLSNAEIIIKDGIVQEIKEG